MRASRTKEQAPDMLGGETGAYDDSGSAFQNVASADEYSTSARAGQSFRDRAEQRLAALDRQIETDRFFIADYRKELDAAPTYEKAKVLAAAIFGRLNRLEETEARRSHLAAAIAEGAYERG